MKELSVIFIFCEKDVLHINELVNNINCNLHISHEIIAVDNRVNKSEKINNMKNVRIIESDFGLDVCSARILGINNAKGKYVWFIDGDDMIENVDEHYNEVLNHNYDCIIFNALTNGSVPSDTDIRECVFAKNDDMFNEKLSSPMWNKWLNTELLKKSVKEIGENIDVFSGDDGLILTAFSFYAENGLKMKENFYNYRSVNSFINHKNEMTKDSYRICIHGTKNMLNKLYDFDMKYNCHKYQNSLDFYSSFFLKKILTVDIADIEDCFKIYTNEFDDIIIEECWRRIMFTDELSKVDIRKFIYLSMIVSNQLGIKNLFPNLYKNVY